VGDLLISVLFFEQLVSDNERDCTEVSRGHSTDDTSRTVSKLTFGGLTNQEGLNIKYVSRDGFLIDVLTTANPFF